MKSYENFSMEAIYRHLITDLIDRGSAVGNTYELRNVSFTLLNPNDCLAQSRNLSLAYLLGEHVWYLKARNDVDFIGKFAPFWLKISDDGLTSNSAYGYLLGAKHGFDQVQLAIDILKKDPDSRRAIVNLNYPNPNRMTTKDEPCTIALQFYVRNGRLECSAMMRSSDIWLGIPYDVPYFTTVQKYVARSLGLPVGPYHHFSVSLHLYTRNLKKALEIHQGATKTYFNAEALLDNLDDFEKLILSYADCREDEAKQDLLIRAYNNGIFKEVKILEN